jgi:haloalkane dehalogenase
MVNRQRLHFLDEGDKQAPPVVMVHGNPSWSFFFRKPVLALRDRWRCIVPDHVGMGLSERPGPDRYNYRLADRIDDLERLLEQIGVTRDITLLLHDWGGMIGMGYAGRHPERIRALIIMNSAAFHLPAGMRLPWQLRLARGALGPVLVQGLNLFCRGAVRYCVSRQPLSADVARAYLDPYASWSQRHAVLRFIQDIPVRPEDQSYRNVTDIDNCLRRFHGTPMLLCWGLRDFVFTEAFLNEWRRRFPDAEVHAWADAGHYLLEDAADEVIPVLRGFLTRHAAKPP